MSRTLRLLALSASGLAFAGAACATNLVANGDFSSPVENGGYGIYQPAPGGWTNLTDTGVEIGATALYGLPCISTGCQNMEVNAYTFGDVVQTITGLTPGETYNLSYDYGGRTGYGPQTLDINFGGSPVSTDSGSFGSWTLYNYVVTATATSEVIEFASEATSGSAGGGNEITNVSLSAVPEPASWAVMLFGFGVSGAVLRRRRAALVA
jgi:hypothetical protein